MKADESQFTFGRNPSRFSVLRDNRRLIHCQVSSCLAPKRQKMHNRAMALEFTTSYLADSITLLHYYKKLGEQAMAQVSDDSLTTTLDAESNSIAIIVKHLTGNMRSRWTDFLASDGEKPDRNRDDEFRASPQTRAEITTTWEGAWKIVFEALAPLTDA